jgi:hypothetical protein
MARSTSGQTRWRRLPSSFSRRSGFVAALDPRCRATRRPRCLGWSFPESLAAGHGNSFRSIGHARSGEHDGCATDRRGAAIPSCCVAMRRFPHTSRSDGGRADCAIRPSPARSARARPPLQPATAQGPSSFCGQPFRVVVAVVATRFRPLAEQLELALHPRAREAAFSLVQYETSLGQLVFEWRRGEDPGPQFLTRHLALLWMVDWLERGRGTLAH